MKRSPILRNHNVWFQQLRDQSAPDYDCNKHQQAANVWGDSVRTFCFPGESSTGHLILFDQVCATDATWWRYAHLRGVLHLRTSRGAWQDWRWLKPHCLGTSSNMFSLVDILAFVDLFAHFDILSSNSFSFADRISSDSLFSDSSHLCCFIRPFCWKFDF